MIYNININGKPKKFNQCDYVGIHLNRKQHISLVHGQRKKCSLCEKYFQNKSNLNRHIKKVHKDMEPHQCHIDSLKHHKKTYHKKINTTSNLPKENKDFL